jgi:hypothetical protein
MVVDDSGGEGRGRRDTQRVRPSTEYTVRLSELSFLALCCLMPQGSSAGLFHWSFRSTPE